MENPIIKNLNDAQALEALYRKNKNQFRQDFASAYPEISDSAAARTWHARLNYDNHDISWGSQQELIFVVIASFLAGCIAKLPEILDIKPDYFYPRNISFIVFPLLIAYFAWKNRLSLLKTALVSVVVISAAVYINLLPGGTDNDTFLLACIHLPLFLWSLLGFAYSGGYRNADQKLDFLRFNGDFAIMTGLILIAGALFSAMTFGLFSLIQIDIEEFYSGYIALWGASAAPIVATYLIQVNPGLVNKVSPVIARIFTPLVLVTLVTYLAAVIYTGKDPYNDRQFLLIFNLLLIAVMGIILFSMAGTAKDAGNRLQVVLLLLLSVATILVNGVALSAIVFRMSEWGITPNRVAVLGGNLLILVNLLIVTYQLFSLLQKKNDLNLVTRSIAGYVPAYGCWAFVVVFILPVIFGFR